MNDAHLHRIPRSETELREALAAACHGKWRMCVPPQVDDHDFVLGDGITELVALRAENARLRAGLDALAACDVAADRADDGVYYRTLTVGDVRRARTLLQSPAISATLNPEP